MLPFTCRLGLDLVRDCHYRYPASFCLPSTGIVPYRLGLSKTAPLAYGWRGFRPRAVHKFVLMLTLLAHQAWLNDRRHLATL